MNSLAKAAILAVALAVAGTAQAATGAGTLYHVKHKHVNHAYAKHHVRHVHVKKTVKYAHVKHKHIKVAHLKKYAKKAS
jgi:hypothetical protein